MIKKDSEGDSPNDVPQDQIIEFDDEDSQRFTITD